MEIFGVMATKQETAVRDNVSTLVNMKPLDIYDKMFQMVFWHL